MRCKEFASVLEQEGLSPLPAAAQAHLASCDDCQNYLADLHSIVECAKQFPAEIEPPQRLWVSLRAQLEAEGRIHEPVVAVLTDSSAGWLQALRGLLRPRALATAGVGLVLVIAAFVQLHKPTASPTQTAATVFPAGQPTVVLASPNSATTQPATVQAPAQRVNPKPLVSKQHPAAAVDHRTTPLQDVYTATPAGMNKYEQEVQGSALVGNPEVQASLRKNLDTVNQFIAECQAHLKKHPQDALAREYLNSALQQKAELIAALLDSGRSEQ